MNDFLDKGEAMFGPSGAAILRQRLEQRALGCELLVCGYDRPLYVGADLQPHVLSVTDPGVVSDYELPGYWAIGNGAYMALSALALRHRAYRHLLPNAIYFACEAKFVAESALGVGRETWVTIHDIDLRVTHLPGAVVEAMREEWERVGRPRKPTRALRRLEQWHKTAKWVGPTGSME